MLIKVFWPCTRNMFPSDQYTLPNGTIFTKDDLCILVM